MSVHVRPERALTGDAVADAGGRPARDSSRPPLHVGGRRRDATGIRILRQRTPPGRRATGDRAAAAGGPVRLHVRSNAPAWFTTTIRNGATHPVRRSPRTGLHGRRRRAGQGCTGSRSARRAVSAVDHEQPDLRAARPIRRQAPRSDGGQPPVSSNRCIGGPSKTSWRVEHDPTSLAAVDLPPATPGPDGTGGEARPGCDSASPADRPRGSMRRSSWIWRHGLAGNDRLVFTGRAEQPMRISVQLRSERGTLAAIRLRRHGRSGADGVFRRPDACRAAPARTSRHAPKSATSCSSSMPSTRGPARRAACGLPTRHCNDRNVAALRRGPSGPCRRRRRRRGCSAPTPRACGVVTPPSPSAPKTLRITQ